VFLFPARFFYLNCNVLIFFQLLKKRLSIGPITNFIKKPQNELIVYSGGGVLS